MADLRITQLQALAAADLSSTDPIAVADISASETKKLTAGDLVTEGVTRLLADGVLPGAKLVAGSITSTQLGTASVGSDELAASAVTYAKIQNVSATDKLLGRSSGGSGVVEEITCTAAGRALLDDASAADQRTTLGLGDLATATGTWVNGSSFSGTSSGTNTGDQTITLTGDVTGTGTGSFATSISAGVVGTTELSDSGVTYAKIQNVTATDRLLGRSSAGAGVVEEIACTAAGRALLDDATAADQRTTLGLGGLATKTTIGTNDIDAASVTAAKISPGTITTALIGEGQITNALIADSAITNGKIQDLTIGYGKLNLADGSIPAAKLQANSLTANEIAPNAIGSSELANDAVDTASIQNLAVTDDKVAFGISGAKLADNSLSGTALVDDSVSGAKISPAAVNRGLDLTGNAIGHTNSIVAGTANGITFDSQGHITATSAIARSDLPLATTTLTGTVSISSTGGLTVSGAGVVTHSNTVTPATISGITFDGNGHITSAAALAPGDLPVATDVDLGGISVPGPALSVDGAGNLSHDSSGVVAGTYTKLTVDVRGHVTAGQQLATGDIPALDASKITTGTFAAERIADGAITAAKIADAGITKVSGAGQFPQPDFLGQFLYSATGILYFAVGTSLTEYMWMPVNDQTSLNKQVRWGGTWNADTGKIATVTSFGTQAGLVIDQDLPAPDTNGVAGLYFICTTAGTGSGYAPAVPFDVGDWVLSLGTSWLRIDVITGGTGTINADQVLLAPAVGSYVAAQDAIAGLHALTQIATDSTLGVIKSSSSIDVDAVTGVATVDVIDEGTY